VQEETGQYFCIVEGSIPKADNGVYCTIGGRSALTTVQDVAGQALATIAVGSCAYDGGLPAAAPNPTGAVGVEEAVPGLEQFVALPGCPVNVENVTATLVHYLTFDELPPTDETGRPLFAYGDKIHRRCERKEHHDEGRFAEEWGDEGHRNGWCLRKLGCRGPSAYHNCPVERWNGATSWPVGAGHGCVACSEKAFWDTYSPFYVPDGQVADFGDDDGSGGAA
jgi:hydrogenase small subunit